MLSFVASYLGTHPHTASQPVPQLAHQSSVGTGSSGGGGGGGLQMWEVQWSELTVLRLVGHGSFGSVYLAEWNQIPVAVKVLVGKGKPTRAVQQLAAGMGQHLGCGGCGPLPAACRPTVEGNVRTLHLHPASCRR